MIEVPTITALDLREAADFHACGDPQPDGSILVGARGGPYRMSELEWISYVALCRAQEVIAMRALETEM